MIGYALQLGDHLEAGVGVGAVLDVSGGQQVLLQLRAAARLGQGHEPTTQSVTHPLYDHHINI